VDKIKTQLNTFAIIASTPLLLGLAPIFGKMALAANADAFGVAALRTVVAVALLWGMYGLFFRKYIYIYPAGLLGCVVIGVINGIGSLFYYGGLTYLDASMVQLINGMYLPMAVMLSHISERNIDRRMLARVALSVVALLVLTVGGYHPLDWLGIGLMLGSALMFAGTFILSKYVLYEMPAPTGALYILTTMGVVVLIVWLAVGAPMSAFTLEHALLPIFALGISTALSRLAMFVAVKSRGSVETAVVAIAEIGVSLLLAALFLGDQLTATQWFGVALLFVSMALIRTRDLLPHGYNPSALLVNTMTNVQFQRIAFHRAFGTQDPHGVIATLSAEELLQIMRMMGADNKPVDPFPINIKGGYRIDLKSFLPYIWRTQEMRGVTSAETRPNRPVKLDQHLVATPPQRTTQEIRITPPVDRDSE
jgi:drug/metabolite transporter (DMT)-like permease